MAFPTFSPLVVLEFSTDAHRTAIEWLIAKLELAKCDGGAELLVAPVISKRQQESGTLYLGASVKRLLQAAEMMDIMKMDIEGHLREFSITDISSFKGAGDLATFLTMAEKQRVILHEIESIRAQADDSHIPGYDDIKLFPGKVIIRKYLSRRIVKQIFPLHDNDELPALAGDWYAKVTRSQPISRVKNYFGETIALYFAFLGLYTSSLIPPTLIGAIYFITSWNNPYKDVFFSAFNLIWVTLFLEVWKRRCSEMTFTWGTLNMVASEEPRASYYGAIGKNRVTGRLEPVYPKWKRSLRVYLVSLPVISACLFVAFLVMLGYFWLQDKFDLSYKDESGIISFLVLLIPTAIYGIVIAIMNGIYRKIARLLNNWENHRLQSAYDNHLILKLVVFDSVNCFVSLFYVAFYMQDMALLRSHLAALLITQQIIGQVREVVLPFFLFRRRAKQNNENVLELISGSGGTSGKLDLSEEVKRQADMETTMDMYEGSISGTLDDYLELFLQFGYVFLFSSAYPLAACWALINNITEIRTDAFKLCRVFQRPFTQPASGIGAWQSAFELISVVAVITNCSLIAMNPEVQRVLKADLTPVTFIMLFVAAEHIILGVKFLLAFIIPDVPKWVQIELARTEYRSRMALQKQKMQESCQVKKE